MTKQANITFKVWLEIERYDDETGHGEDMDAPGSSLAAFETYEEARDYAERAARLAESINLQTGRNPAMTTIEHTPGRWKVENYRDSDIQEIYIVQESTGGEIAVIYPTFGQAKADIANARRIVAAVNACEGIGTEALERHVPRKMLAALQMASNYMADDLDEDDETEMRVFRAIGAAIAEAKAAA